MASYAITATSDRSQVIRYLQQIHLAENAGTPAAAKVFLKNGSSGGTLFNDIRLAASESKSTVFDPPLYFPLGLYVEVAVGTVRGSVTGY